jgi:glutamine amidotransferase
MKTVAILDYGMGNLDSVARAVEECGGRPIVTSHPEDIEEAEEIILPGVGAFALGMANIRRLGLDGVIREQALRHRIPVLGLCLGMQLLGTHGAEGGEADGLDLVPGEIVRLRPDGHGTRIPHVGWNEVNLERDSPLFRGIPSGKDFYFVHSYHLVPRDPGDLVARTPYCGGFASVVGRGNVHGVQFHPEKSQAAGFQLLRNFLAL